MNITQLIIDFGTFSSIIIQMFIKNHYFCSASEISANIMFFSVL